MRKESYIIIEIDNIKYAIPYSKTIQNLVHKYVTLEGVIKIHQFATRSGIPYNANHNLEIMDTMREKREIEKQILKYIEERDD